MPGAGNGIELVLFVIYSSQTGHYLSDVAGDKQVILLASGHFPGWWNILIRPVYGDLYAEPKRWWCRGIKSFCKTSNRHQAVCWKLSCEAANGWCMMLHSLVCLPEGPTKGCLGRRSKAWTLNHRTLQNWGKWIGLLHWLGLCICLSIVSGCCSDQVKSGEMMADDPLCLLFKGRGQPPLWRWIESRKIWKKTSEDPLPPVQECKITLLTASHPCKQWGNAREIQWSVLKSICPHFV